MATLERRPPAIARASRPSETMTLVEHLEELRVRLFKVLAMVAVASVLAFCWHNALIDWLTRPAGPVRMVFTTPVEAFKAGLTISLYAGLALASPGVLYQLLAFFIPALTRTERRWLLPLGTASLALFALGGALGYYWLLPAGLRFLLGFAPSDVHAMLSLGDYLSFAATVIAAGGVMCELPVALVALAQLGLVSSAQLARARRVAVVAAFALGMLVAPSPDPLTQALMAGILLVLYELSVRVVRWSGK